MNYILRSISILLIVSCSHAKLGHTNYAQEHQTWNIEDNRIATDHKEASMIFKWFGDHINEHQNEISMHKKIIAEHEKELKILENSSGNPVEIAKIKSKFSQKHFQMGQEHKHFLKVHNKVMKIVNELKVLKKKLELHPGHSH